MYFYSGHHGAGQLVNRHSRTDALFRLPALLSRRRLRRRLGRRLGRCRGRRLGRRRAVRVANSLLLSSSKNLSSRERERETMTTTTTTTTDLLAPRFYHRNDLQTRPFNGL